MILPPSQTAVSGKLESTMVWRIDSNYRASKEIAGIEKTKLQGINQGSNHPLSVDPLHWSPSQPRIFFLGNQEKKTIKNYQENTAKYFEKTQNILDQKSSGIHHENYQEKFQKFSWSQSTKKTTKKNFKNFPDQNQPRKLPRKI